MYNYDSPLIFFFFTCNTVMLTLEGLWANYIEGMIFIKKEAYVS